MQSRIKFLGVDSRLLLIASVALSAFALLSFTVLAMRSGFRSANSLETGKILLPSPPSITNPVAGAKRSAQNVDDAPGATVSASHVRRGAVEPHLLPALRALGDRLERSGKERASFVGTFRQEGAPSETPLTVVREYPDRLRVEAQHGAGREVTVFDGSAAHMANGEAASGDEGLIESLVYDTADYFFLAQVGGGASRHLGSGFRPEGTPEVYAGPTYEVYQLSFPVRSGGRAEQRTKTYYFNSATRLLESVRYTVERDGYETEVEVKLSGWQQVMGQSFPARIERLEGGRPVWSLTLVLDGVGAAARDGVFNAR